MPLFEASKFVYDQLASEQEGTGLIHRKHVLLVEAQNAELAKTMADATPIDIWESTEERSQAIGLMKQKGASVEEVEVPF